MPDILHWLGVTHIDRFIGCNMKYDAIIGSGITIRERVPIPAELIPPDAEVELEAKKAAGYYAPELVGKKDLTGVLGRGLDELDPRLLQKAGKHGMSRRSCCLLPPYGNERMRCWRRGWRISSHTSVSILTGFW